MTPTTLSKEIDSTLRDRHQRTLNDVVAEMRTAGKGWRTIAAHVQDLAEIYVSHETLRAWFRDDFVIVPRDRAPGS